MTAVEICPICDIAGCRHVRESKAKMTHPTNEELDALVAQQTRAANERDEFEALMNADRTVQAITALRTQLAEVQADLTFMTENRNKWQDSATQRWFRIVEAEARAGLVEAEVRSLKTAIFGSENYAHDLKCGNFVEMAQTLHAAQKGGLDRAERAEAALDKAREETKDAISTLESWFDRRELGHKAVDQAVLDAASGYLRTSRSGGMPQKKSDLVLAVFQDMARLGAFADLFARAAKTQVEAALAAQIEADALVCDELAAACAMALALAANDTPEVRTAVAYSIKIAKRCAAAIRSRGEK